MRLRILARARPLRPTLLMVYAGAVLAAAVLGVAGWALLDARQAVRHQAEQAAGNLALSLERDIGRTIDSLDLSLRAAAQGMRTPGLTALDPAIRQSVLFDGAAAAEGFGGIFVTDESGQVIYDSLGPAPRRINVADRAYFQAHRERPDLGLVVSEPLRNRGDGAWTLALARRLSHPDGTFAGVVVGGLRVGYFDGLFRSLALGEHGNVSLFSTDKRLVARRPSLGQETGRDVGRAEVFRHLADAPSGAFEAKAALDGVRRLYSYRRVGSLPLVLNVGLATEDIYAEWSEKAAVLGGVLLVLALLGVELAWALRRELRRRARLEAQLRESEAGFRLLAEHASDMVSRVGPDGARLYVSPAASRIFGAMPEALLGRGVLERAVPEDRPALEASAARLLTGAAEQEEVAFRTLHPDRGEVWVEAVARALRHPATGAPDGYVSVVRDMTERRRTEAALAASEARYRLLADTATDAITCLDLELRRTYASPACHAVYGREPGQMLGSTPADAMHPDDLEESLGRFRRVAAGEAERDRATYRVRHGRGHWVWVEVDLGLVRDAATGRPASLTCAVRDISERRAQADELERSNAELERLARHLARARDAAEAASRAKSRFLAGMSHELRTPLNGILGYAQLLRLEGGLSAAQGARVDAMLGAGQHLLEMINRVLDLSEVEAERIELRSDEVDPHEVARACLDLVRPMAEAKGLALGVNAAPGTPRRLTTDATRLRQVLLNLLGNAVKFTAHGAVELRLRLAGEDTGGTALRIEVADTGPGIAAEQRHRLFQDFERLGAEADGAVEGAGLGLALSARLAELLGGRLGYEDNPAEGGSVFWLELPLVAVPMAPVPALEVPPTSPPLFATADEPENATQAASAAAATRPLRILVVDDVAMNRDIAGAFLRAAGHEVASAEGGAEAVEAAAAGDFDAILIDVRMPGIDGLEATRRIRALAGPRGRVPVVALTAQAFAEQVAECRAVGMNDHLAKPFIPEALLAVVTRAVVAGRGRGEIDDPASVGDARTTAPTMPALGSELPVLDAAAFERTAAFLAPEAVVSYLRTIAGRGEDLLRGLRARGALAEGAGDLAAAAHTLAGSAGMFGFERLAAVARRFEFAAQSGVPGVQALGDGLAAAIEVSLQQMPSRRVRAATAAVASTPEHSGATGDLAAAGV